MQTSIRISTRFLADKSTKIFAVGGVGMIGYGVVVNNVAASNSGWWLVGASILTFVIGAMVRRVN